jgi:hypothetical protein
MPFCYKCGAQVNAEDEFCESCGASLRAGLRRRITRRTHRDRDLCFSEELQGDPLGIIDIGLLLLIVGVVYQLNSGVFSEFISWVQGMGDVGIYIKPPDSMVNSVITFFRLIGASNFLTAIIRLQVDRTPKRIIADIFSGIALIVFAYLINLHFNGVMTWMVVLAYEAIVIGILVIVGVLLTKVY